MRGWRRSGRGGSAGADDDDDEEEEEDDEEEEEDDDDDNDEDEEEDGGGGGGVGSSVANAGGGSAAKLHACTQCPSAFSDASKLKRHMQRTHLGFHAYPCDECTSAFKTVRFHARARARCAALELLPLFTTTHSFSSH